MASGLFEAQGVLSATGGQAFASRGVHFSRRFCSFRKSDPSKYRHVQELQFLGQHLRLAVSVVLSWNAPVAAYS